MNQLDMLIRTLDGGERRVVIDTVNKTVTADGRKIRMTLQEFDMLVFLTSKAGEPQNRDQIVEGAWNFKHVAARTVDVHARKLRSKLGDNIITTFKKVGYAINLEEVCMI